MKSIVQFSCIVSAFLVVSNFNPSPAQAMTEEELCQLYLDVVEDAVDVFEPLWVDDSDRVPNSGFFDFRKYGDWMDEPYATIITVCGTGHAIYCYAILLTETEQETFGEKKLTRAELMDRCVKAFRWCCLTSIYVENPYYYLPNTRPQFRIGDHWRRVYGYRADEVGWLTMAAAILWDQLDAETKDLCQDVFTGGANLDRDTKTWYPVQGGNHDQVKQDLSSTMGAAYLFPELADLDFKRSLIAAFGIDMVSTLHDFTCGAIADGKPVREWAEGWNLYQDYSCDHHGWCNLWYGGDMLFEGYTYIHLLSALTGVPMPETFTYDGNGFEGVLKFHQVLSLPEGESAAPHGAEYDSYYGVSLLIHCYGAVVQKDPFSAALEERAANLLKRHSRAIRRYDYHRNSWAKAGTAYLMHKYAGPRAEPLPYHEAYQSLDGAYHYRWLRCLIHRTKGRWNSFAWGSISSNRDVTKTYGNGLTGFVVPSRLEVNEPEPLVYLHPESLIGDIQVQTGNEKERKVSKPNSLYTYQFNDAGFHTAGLVTDPVLDRYYAYFSFEDGPCVMFTQFQAKQDCRLRWTGLPVYFYARPGFTSSRHYYDAQGAQALEQEALRDSNWWCVEDLLGMVVSGGNNQLKIERRLGYNWARQPEYKDKCDTVFASPMNGKALRAGGAGVDLITAIYANTPHNQIAEHAQQLRTDLPLPQGWRGAIAPAPSNRRVLAIANFSGSVNQTILNLTYPEGAPVLSNETIIEGGQSAAWIQLDSLESYGETIELYAETMNERAVRASKCAANQYAFEPVEPGTVGLRLQFFGEGAEQMIVRGVNGGRIKTIPCKTGALTTVMIDRPVLLEFEGGERVDRIRPSVEISAIDVREDLLVTIHVKTSDRSGIQSVEWFCDGESIGKRTNAPYTLTHRPKAGPHTYYAIATDTAGNQRISFKRTIRVEQ